MNLFVKFIVVSSFFVASAFAEESFGGVGMVYKLTSSGAEVQDVIPKTPVAETKIKVGDVIVAVDGESILGKKSREVRNVLRGPENKPVVFTYVSEGDTLVETVRRMKLTLKSLNDVADVEQPGKNLLAILDGGRVAGEAKTSISGGFEAIYTDKMAVSVMDDGQVRQVKDNFAKLVTFSRSVIRVKLKTEGAFIVSVVDSNGDVVRSFVENHGHAGINSVFWDGSLVPDGRYVISVEHNGNVSGVNILLK